MRWVLRGLGVVLLVLMLAWAVLHWFIVPRIDEFRPRLQQLASRAISAPVSIGALQAESNGLVPTIVLRDVGVRDPAGRTGLRVPRVLVTFSVLSLVRGGLEQLVIDRPELELRRTADGRLLVGGLDLSGDAEGDTAAADWFFSQPEFVVRGGRVRWVDERRAAPPVELQRVDFVARNRFGSHQLRLDATPEVGWGDHFALVGLFRQPLLSRHAGYWREWGGRVYADLARVDVSQLRHYVDLKTDWGIDLQGGHGALRAWADVRKGQLAEVTADLALGDVSATFGPALEPLAFASLAGRLGWRNPGSGMEISTRDLRFVDADGLAWPGGNVQLSYNDGAQGLPAGGSLVGDRLDLAALAKIALRLPLPEAVRARLLAHPVQGMVNQLNVRWSGALEAPTDWRVQTTLTRLSIAARPAPPRADGRAVEGLPGVEGAALVLDATPFGGRAGLAVRNGALEFPGVFAEPRVPLADLSAAVHWRVKDGQIALDVERLALRNDDATGSFKARWATLAGAQGAARFPGTLDLSGRFDRADGARVFRYLPLGIPQSARDYVRAAVVKGQARNVAVRVKGDLRRVGDAQPEPGSEFRFAGQVSGVTLDYVPRFLQPAGQPPWPALEDLSGELIFDHNSMQVQQAAGRVRGHPGWQFTSVQAGIADLGHTRVRVDAVGGGALASALGIVNASPVGGFLHGALAKAGGEGAAGLKLLLDLPVDHIERAAVQGQLALSGNTLRLSADAPELTQVHGAVAFNDRGFTLERVRAQALGGEVQVSGGTQAGAQGAGTLVRVRAVGRASAEGLRHMTQWAPLPALAGRASGSAGYEAVLEFPQGEPMVQVSSDLRGLAIDLPAPFDKPADQPWPLRFDSGSVAGAPALRGMHLSVQDRLDVRYERDAASGRVLRGVLALGQGAPALPEQGVMAHLTLARLDADAWDDALRLLLDRSADGAAAPASGDGAAPSGDDYLPSRWTLQADELATGDHTLHALKASGTRASLREGARWRADVQARELAGWVEYNEGAGGRAGKLLARLSRLSVPQAEGGGDQSPLAQPAANIPALDVVVDDFELRGKSLGRLEIRAVNRDVATSRLGGGTPQDWELSRLVLQSPEATFTASGRWAAMARAPALPVDPRAPRAADDPRRTALEFRLDVRDAGKLLARLGMPDVLARGKGALDGRLEWRGAPLSPHYPSMQGQLHVDVGAGQFLKADPGAAKLLGVLSLQSLPRRLTLDFRDLFSAGFAFDFVRGDVEVQRGMARTNNLQMKGASAAVLMSGSADIDQETQDLRVLVVPEIDAGTAALVATAINPAIGIGTFLAQLVLKRPLIKAATREFHIGGSWDDPSVERVPVSAPASAASAPG